MAEHISNCFFDETISAIRGMKPPSHKKPPLINDHLELRGVSYVVKILHCGDLSLRRRRFVQIAHGFLTENTFSQCKSPPISKKAPAAHKNCLDTRCKNNCFCLFIFSSVA